ncbi:MAG: ankyrin repeat domain-containing protein [Planctomycetota bacterium]|jgi:ankyrin repeat protein
MRIGCHKVSAVLVAVTGAILLSGCRKSLHDAVQYSDLKSIRKLIRKGANVNARDEEGRTPLYIAAAVGRVDVAELLIANDAEIDAPCSKSGWTPLHRACTSRRGAAVVELLVLKGADIGALDHTKGTPLHAAAIGGNPETVRFLVEKDANVNARDQNGRTPLYWAVEYQGYRYKEIVQTLLSLGAKVLMEHKTGSSPLGVAVLQNDLEVAHVLAAAIDKGWRNEYGEAVLHWAVRQRKLELVKLLVEHGADLNAKDAQGYTPLDVAINYVREKDITDFLRSKGAKGG